LLNILYSVVKEQKTRHASRALYSVHRKRVKGPFYQSMAGYSLQPHALTALSHAANRQDAQPLSNRREDNKASVKSQGSFACIIKNNVTVRITPIDAAKDHSEGPWP
jgi:hypothetical protein